MSEDTGLLLWTFALTALCATVIVVLANYLKAIHQPFAREAMTLAWMVSVTSLIGIVLFWPILGFALIVKTLEGILMGIIFLCLPPLLIPTIRDELRQVVHRKSN